MNPRPLLLVALLAVGCGGEGQAGVRGRMAVRVAWPSKDARVIPTAAQSVRVQALQGATVVNQAILTAVAPEAVFSDVPTGSITVKAVAFPTVGATGTPMASAQTAQTIAANGTAVVSLTMNSTIDRLTISPTPVNLALLGLLTRQLTVTAYDASNAIVLTAPGDFSYAATNNLLFSVSSTGLVTGLALGTASVTATDAISGKSASASVVVTTY